jgi:Asp-tRNA(Asn)/Glu-tRNA(Gln) amidotransferase A subunit family amidase
MRKKIHRNLIGGICIFALFLLTACSTHLQQPFSKRDVRAAQRILGLGFTPAQIDTMYRYLERNLKGYKAMQNIPLDYQIPPALYFDPRPDGFVMPTETKQADWGLPDSASLPENPEELAFLSVGELSALLKNRQISSEALTRLFIARIRRYDASLHAVVTLLEEHALQQARRADVEIAAGHYRGPLHGIPYAIKDLFALSGHPTTWGATPYKDQVFDHTASVITRLDTAGAILLAKVSTGALARGDVWFGGMTRNPWDTLQGASGSSAGSAAAVSAGLCAFAIGTETLGSIVAPSARCGVTGLRPTYGRVSRTGVMTLSWTMDKVGPIGRNALDCALVLEAIRGQDGKDRTVQEAPFSFQARQSPTTLRVAYLKTAFDKDSTQAGDNNRAALQVFRDLGIPLAEESLPDSFPYSAFDIILRAESGAFFDELIRSGQVDRLEEQHEGSRANSLRQARFIPAPEYLQANRHRKQLQEAMGQLMQRYDVLIVPPSGSEQNLLSNLSGHPALALPTGFDQRGRPSSITLLGKLYDEATILELGHAFQQITDFEGLHPPLFLGKVNQK